MADADAEEAIEKSYDSRLMRRLLGYLRPYRGMTAGAVALILGGSLLQLVGPIATSVAIDLFVRPPGATGTISPAAVAVRDAMVRHGLEPGSVRTEGIVVTAGIFLVAVLLAFLLTYLQGFVMQVMGQYIMRDLRAQIFAHLQRLPISYFDASPVGRLVTRVTTDVDALNELFAAGLVSAFGDVVVLAGIVVVLFWLNWQLALVAFGIVPLLIALTSWFRSRVQKSFRVVRVKIARINAYLQEHITGMAVVQLFGREARAYADFSRINDEHREANVRSIFYYALFFPGVELISTLGLGLLLWLGGIRVAVGAASVGALIAFFQYAQRFYQPLSDLAEKYNILQGAMAASERIFELLDTPAAIATPERAYRPGRMKGEIEFDRVSFSYVPGEEVLHGVSFRVEPGQTIAVVGHTGAGKSTLANLLLRFYDVSQGAVRVDGVDVRDWDLSQLRRGVALVLQDVFLFSGTIGANIRLGEEAIDGERLRQAAREVNALDFIERLPGGFDALVQERGAGLSVGQKQLVAFARALAFDPRVLILDEATSSIDTETEQRIQAALLRLLAGRTSLVIAHRLSTIQRADRILVMHKGEIREQGTHQELLAARGIYHRLYRLQYQAQAEAETLAGEAWA
ncbi:MAG TPA: ABC transporter ATP-binding protein [Thermoanaerobaculia bacterium]|nr:ABC transporter ATP-binding protein [Thermoanaerobaculia bacterium]